MHAYLEHDAEHAECEHLLRILDVLVVFDDLDVDVE